jgi:DNA invertase Pin-like site-specific DNA recombinase
MVNNGGFIAYFRVSTTRQGKSGLGIEAQRQAVATYLNGGNWRIIGEFTEIESGKRADRPELDKALAAARVRQVPLVVAKLDRLTRSVSFLSRLLDAGVDVASPTCRRSKAQPASSCCSRWQPLPSLKPA